MEVTVVSVDAMGVCTNCGIRKTVGPATLRIIRQWCFGANSFCTRCCRLGRSGGVQDNVIEMCMPDGQVHPTFHI